MNYMQALEWLSRSIRHGTVQRYPGQRGLDRTRALLAKLGNPQNRVRVIHVAGTSGKGSTATMIASLLRSQGFPTGLSLSPSVINLRERFGLSDRLPSKRVVAEALSLVRSTVEQLEETPSYFEVLTATAYWIFASQGCQYAVMETGMGGTYDATNVVDLPQKLAVITRIGLDHRHTLGQTEALIAAHKAGIIGLHNQVVALSQSPEVNHVVADRCLELNATLEWVETTKAVEAATVSIDGTDFVYQPTFPSRKSSPALLYKRREPPALAKGGMRGISTDTRPIHLKLIGKHQAENATIALNAVEVLAVRDGWPIHWQTALAALETVRIPARFDVRRLEGKTVILDGAHNPQKMAALLCTLQSGIPNEKLVFVVGFKQGKQAEAMLKQIQPLASSLILTDICGQSAGPVRSLKKTKVQQLLNHFPSIEYISDPAAAFAKARTLSGTVVITGSLYLCASMYAVIRTTVGEQS